MIQIFPRAYCFFFFNSICYAFRLSRGEHTFGFIKLPCRRVRWFFRKGINKFRKTVPSAADAFIFSAIGVHYKVFFRGYGFALVIFNMPNFIFKQLFQKLFCSFDIIFLSFLEFRSIVLKMIMVGKIEYNDLVSETSKPTWLLPSIITTSDL